MGLGEVEEWLELFLPPFSWPDFLPSSVRLFLRSLDEKINRSYSMRMAVFVVVLTFVLATSGLIAAVVCSLSWHEECAFTGSAEVVFTSQIYDLQSGLFSLEGSIRGLGPGQELWVVFRDSQSDRLFPAQAPCEVLPGNMFSCLRISTGAPSPSKPNVKGFMAVAASSGSCCLQAGRLGVVTRTVSLYGLPDGVTLVSKIAIGS